MTHLGYDLTPLSGDRTTQEVRGAYTSRAPVVGWLIGGTVVFVGLVTTLVQWIGGDRDDLVIGLIVTGLGALLWLAVWLVARLVDRRAAGRAARIAAFAHANGFKFDGEARATGLPGVYRHGWQEKVYDRVQWSMRGLPVEAARYYRRENGRYTNCFYLAVRMDVPVDAATFYCGRSGPSAGGPSWKGTDVSEAKPVSPRPAEHGPDPLIRELFDDSVVALLVDDEWPCNAEYLNGSFWAYYRSGDGADPGRWRHMCALADAVAGRKQALSGAA